jgi:hypothetical protein
LIVKKNLTIIINEKSIAFQSHVIWGAALQRLNVKSNETRVHHGRGIRMLQ